MSLGISSCYVNHDVSVIELNQVRSKVLTSQPIAAGLLAAPDTVFS